MKCESCVPEVEYLCSKHREKNQCGGCNRKNQKLRLCIAGELCNDCMRKAGVVF